MEKTKKFELHILVVSLFFFAFVLSVILQQQEQAKRIALCNQAHSALVQKTFAPVFSALQAKSAYVYNFSKNAPLYGKSDTEVRPLASLTKLMTARLAQKSVLPTSEYTIASHDLDSDGFVGFVVGDTYHIADLFAGALIASSNDSAVMLARSTKLSDTDFVTHMNTEAAQIGLPSLHFANPTGLDIENDTVATAYGSAHDILMLLHKNYVDFPELMSLSVRPTMTISATNGRSILLKNTDLVIDKLPLLLASKTGYTDVAGGNLAVLWREPSGDILGASVLGSTETGRFDDMVAIHDAADNFVAGIHTLPQFCKSLSI